MKCDKCPSFSSWNNESDKGENCELFGDGWDSDLQYEDKDGTIIGCYIERKYIMKVQKRKDDYLNRYVDWYLNQERILKDKPLDGQVSIDEVLG